MAKKSIADSHEVVNPNIHGKMKRKSPSIFLAITVLLLSTVFSGKAFAMRPGLIETQKFSVWNIGKPDTERELGNTGELLEKKQNNFDRLRNDESENDESDRSLFKQRGDGIRAREDGVAANSADKNFRNNAVKDVVEDLLEKPDEEILIQLRDNERVRKEVLRKMKEYGKETTEEIFLSNYEEEDSPLSSSWPFDSVVEIEDEEKDDWMKARERKYKEAVEQTLLCVIELEEYMQQAKRANNYSQLLEGVRIAKGLHSVADEKKKLTQEIFVLLPNGKARLPNNFVKALQDWKKDFMKFVEAGRKVTIVGTEFLKSGNNPILAEATKDQGKAVELTKQVAQDRLKQIQNLIEQARNSSNSDLTEDEIHEKNEILNRKKEELDQRIKEVLQAQARLEEFGKYQKFLSSLRQDLQQLSETSAFIAPFDQLNEHAAKRLLQKHSSVTSEKFINSSVDATEIVSQWRVQKRDYKQFKQKVNEAKLAHLTNKEAIKDSKLQQAKCLEALSQLRFDTAPILVSMREKLDTAYQKIISLDFILDFMEKKFTYHSTLLPDEKKIYQELLKLRGLLVLVLAEGRTNIAEALTKIIEQYRIFLIEREWSLQPLLLQAELKALCMKMKTEPAMKEIVDEAMASFPWDFEKSYDENIEMLESMNQGGRLEAAKTEKLQALKKRLASEVATSTSLIRSMIRRESQFPVIHFTREARVAELQKLQDFDYQEMMIDDAEKLLTQFRNILSNERIYDTFRARLNVNKDPLLSVLEGEIKEVGKIKKKNVGSKDNFLKRIERVKLLEPYVKKKIELCKLLAGIEPNEQYFQNCDKIEYFWNGINEMERNIFKQLDNLATSRLFAEQTIAEKNDPYLTHALDEIRSEAEQKFQQDLQAVLANHQREQNVHQLESFSSRAEIVVVWAIWSFVLSWFFWFAYNQYCLLSVC